MKDCKGNELNVGDAVIVSSVEWTYEDVDGILQFGRILELPKTQHGEISVDICEDWTGANPVQTFTTFKSILKITGV